MGGGGYGELVGPGLNRTDLTEGLWGGGYGELVGPGLNRTDLTEGLWGGLWGVGGTTPE